MYVFSNKTKIYDFPHHLMMTGKYGWRRMFKKPAYRSEISSNFIT